MNKKILTLIGICASFLAVSCQKDAPKTAENAFEYNGVQYNTLQEAVSAAEKAFTGSAAKMTFEDLLDIQAVKVNKNASGEGAAVSDDFEGAIVIDFQDHQYTLTDNGNIGMSGGKLLLKGEGGCLAGEGGNPSIVCEKGAVILGGSLKVSAPSAFKGKKSAFTLFEKFSGALEGDVSLDSSAFTVFSPKANIHISSLEMPSSSILSVPAQMTSPVVIDKCALNVSPGIVPICANYEGNIKTGDGTAVHVHDWEVITTPATCTSGPKTKKKCKTCGQIVIDVKANIESQHDYATCAASDLVHHPGLKATDTEFGNIEYWECSRCGRQYSDSEGNSPIEGSVLLRPNPYDYDQSVFNYGDMFQDLFRPQTKAGAMTIINIIGTIASVAGMGLGIAGLFTGDDYSGDFDAINERLDELDEQMEEMSDELEDISDQLTQINSQLEILNQSISEVSEAIDDIDYNTNQILEQMSHLTSDIEATQLLSARHNTLVSLRAPTESAVYSLGKHAEDFTKNIAAATTYKDSLDVCNKFTDEIKNLIVNIWSGTYECAKSTSDLMAQFTSMSYGASSTFPKVLETYANCHVDWENQGYSYRVGTLEEERYILSMAFGLLQIYYCFAGDHYFMESMLNTQYAQDTKIAELTDEDIEKMKECYNDYRLYNPSNMKFKATLSKIDYEHLDEFVYFEELGGEVLVDEAKEEQFHNNQGIYKDKCLSDNDLEVLKSSWQNSSLASTTSFISYMCDAGIGGVEFLGGTGTMVFPFIEDNDSYTAYYTDYEEVSYENTGLTIVKTDRCTAKMFKKIWQGPEPGYSQCCNLYVYEYIEKSSLVSTFYPTTIYADEFYHEFVSIRDEQPDSYAFNTCTPKFY